MGSRRWIGVWCALVALLVLLAGCQRSIPETGKPEARTPSKPQASASAPQSTVAWSVESFLHSSYRAIALRSPLNVTYEGLSAIFGVRDDTLDDVSVEYVRETYQLVRRTLTELRSHPRDALAPASQLNYDLYENWLATKLDGESFAFHNYDPVTATIDRLYDIEAIWPVTTDEDVEDYLSRLSQFRRYYRQQIDGLAYREKAGILAPQFMVEDAIATIEGLLGLEEGGRPSDATEVDVENAPVFQSIAARLESRAWESSEARDAVLAQAKAVTKDEVIPALWSMLVALDDVLPRSPEVGGATALPNGKAFFEYSLRQATTLPLTADDLRRIGQAEVDRVLAETHTILAELGHPELSNYQELMRLPEYSRRNYDLSTPESQEAYLSVVRTLAADAATATKKVIDLWPSTEMEIRPDPQGYGNSCTPPALDGSRPGYFSIGLGTPTADYGRTPLIVYHEGIPGHFLQMSVAQGLDLPLMRRVERHTAYVEGWAMYSERLAWELGLYGDRSPLYRLAQLEGELVRACRLVIDAGIHDQGWSHIEAGQYLERITGLELPGYAVMDTYIGRPGWASSYTIGLLEILRLRDKARTALGERFDLREFHRAVLSQGSVPLPILEKLVDRYIEAAGETGRAEDAGNR
ncbi:MAG: DUF885 domain-containing protein [Thermotogota bacterium]